MEAQAIVKNFERLSRDRASINGMFSLIERYVVPFRSEVYSESTDENSINWRNRTLFDSTAVSANETLASTIHGSITSMSTKWFSLRFRNDALNEDFEAMEWLQECENITFEALQDSNFDIEASEFYLDLTSYGTSIIVEEVESETDWNGIDFVAVPITECYFDQDHKGRIVNFYRELKWTAEQIIEKFGRDNVPKSVLDKENSNDKMSIIFAIFKRNVEANPAEEIVPKERQYGFKYILKEGNEMLGEEGGYYEMPAFVARWRKTSRSRWGFSPAFVCMSDVLTLQQIVEDTLEALGKVIDPATLTTMRGLLSDLDLGRSGVTVVKDINDVKPYESNARFDVGEVKIRNLQDSINRAYHIDKLQLKDSPAMTAEEVRTRYEIMQRMLGPTLGRLTNDFLDPLIKRTFNILYRAKKLPPMPQIVADSQATLNIEYVGPMARAQKQQVVNSTYEWLSGIGQISEIFPEARDIPDVDMVVRETGLLTGVPVKYMRPRDQIEEERMARAEEMAKERRTVNTQQEAQAAKEAAEAEKAMGEV